MSKNWDLVLLGNILTERQEKPDMDDLLTGKIPIVEKIAFNEGKIYLRNDGKTKTGMILIRSGDLVLSGINATKGAIAIYPETEKIPMAATIHYSSYIVDKNKVDISFLWWLLRSKKFKEILNEYLPGGIKTELKAKRFLPIPIPLPPLEEQKRIVEKIEEVRSLRLQNIEETEALIISSRIEIFDQALKRNAKRFDEVAYLERGKFSHRPRNEPRFFGGQHPWIQIAEIESSGKYIKNWQETLNDEGLTISRKFPKGTLLISIAATIGAVGILTFDCCIPDSIVAITPKENMSSEYLYYYLCYLRTSLEKIAPQSAQKNINLRILQPLPVPVMPLSEQKRIVEYLDRLQSKIEIMKKEREKALEETDALLPSILDKAFKREL
ncbi:type I restriction-modification system [Geminocystis sp. NIES-3708]|uniref:restriction endonuclease subunit S n=1 Tax=Geminocystis sp. NIES-3708 TaxID=1615909 RepID=UPI0005FC8D86|nr:restriction endonuclease subunit S [Geminocystis sp. NIES-3708]BAQ61918.1 type I restriction-modification system [Geminocystis sp. NIES-3708]